MSLQDKGHVLCTKEPCNIGVLWMFYDYLDYILDQGVKYLVCQTVLLPIVPMDYRNLKFQQEYFQEYNRQDYTNSLKSVKD